MAAARSSSQRTLVKVLVPLVLVVLGGIVFWQTVRSARAQPYTISAASQLPWRLAIARGSAPNEPVLVLEPPPGLASELFDQTFKRSMNSMRAPDVVGIPLVLVGELPPSVGDLASPEALLEMARAAGLEGAPPAPRCMGHRRAPEPDTRQEAYFAIFDSPPYARFRASLAARLGASFNIGSPTPALPISFVESSMFRWMPLHADVDRDCVAPISAGATP